MALAPAAAPQTPELWYVTAPRLLVRQGPGSTNAVVGELARGFAVACLGEVVETNVVRWFRVRTVGAPRELEGWVSAPFLTRNRQLLEGRYPELVYGPIEKRSYPKNPRRQVRALYVSLNALDATRFADILALVQRTSLNALVIDYKDDDGLLITTSPAAERWNPAVNRHRGSRQRDLAGLVRRLRALDIYVIARIVTFKDPIYAEAHPGSAILDGHTGRPFRSRDGLTWSSPFDADFRAYNLALAEEAAAIGFQEIQFDYVRFPDVPKSARLDYRTTSGQSKPATIQDFLLEARRRLAPLQVYVAADVFGLVCTTRDDMRIGQYWEAMSNAVDYICPMMYPSHYSNRNYGLPVPDQFPYELIDRGIRDAIRRNRNLDTPGELRPWLQAFTAPWVKGYRNYGPAEVQAQIRALADNNIQSYLMWHSGGKYQPEAYR